MDNDLHSIFSFYTECFGSCHYHILYVTCVGSVYKRVEECGRSLPSEVIDLLATSISVNTGYTSRIVVSPLKNSLFRRFCELGLSRPLIEPTNCMHRLSKCFRT